MTSGMLNMGMVGGGPGSLIGDVHRLTAEAYGKAKLTCGFFSTNPERNRQKGKELGMDPSRVYHSLEDLIQGESRLSKDERMDFLAITTPNHVHVEAARMALENGFHVMCDKPLGISLKESIPLQTLLEQSGLKFGMTYTYRGYGAIRHFKKMILNGSVGQIRKIIIDYSQGWLTTLIENEGHRQASWRTDPKTSGAGGTIADIGTHAFNLLEYLADDRVMKLCGQVSALVEGRKIDDDANVLLETSKNIKGAITVGQALAGEENNITANVYGSKASLHWENDKPDELILKEPDSEPQHIKASEIDVDESKLAIELPPGHSNSFLKGFITIYDAFIDDILGKPHHDFHYPDLVDGLRGMQFIEKAILSSDEEKWVQF